MPFLRRCLLPFLTACPLLAPYFVADTGRGDETKAARQRFFIPSIGEAPEQLGYRMRWCPMSHGLCRKEISGPASLADKIDFPDPGGDTYLTKVVVNADTFSGKD